MAMGNEEHYLKTELYDLVRKDPAIFEFLQAGSLDGIWYGTSSGRSRNG